MAIIDPRIDAYIEKAQPFAQPILKHLRMLVHNACPQVEETVKWGHPHFDYKGVMCHMAAFKQHCALGFWKAALMKDPAGIFIADVAAAGSIGRITSLAALPADKTLTAYLQEAAGLNDAGIKQPPKLKATAKAPSEMETPDYFAKLLKEHPAALEVWNAFAPSRRKEYLLWITEAKTAQTREKRMATSIEQILEGKQRHWKYQEPR